MKVETNIKAAFLQTEPVRSSCKTIGSILLLLVIAALPSWAQDRSNKRQIEFLEGHEVVSQEVLVKFRSTTLQSISPAQATAQVGNSQWAGRNGLQSILEAQAAVQADESEWVGGNGVLRLHSSQKSVAALIKELSARPDVEYAQPNYIYRPDSIPSDANFGQLWGLQNTGQSINAVGAKVGLPGADIKSTAAWDISKGSRANVVAVIDSGIDYMHPDLAANVWSAPTAFTVTIGGQAITCPAGSHGFNVITRLCDPMDDGWHGSHVSGTIGAVGNNGIGVVGVNWTASIMGIKFFDAIGRGGTTADAINAIEFAIQAKAAFAATGGANVRVLSNSWGGPGFDQALLDKINLADTKDMLFVAAAGNNGTDNNTSPHYPASFNAPNVVAVAATDNQDALGSWDNCNSNPNECASNFGATSVHLGAPGVYIYSVMPNSQYGYANGTSMATPHVSGAAALILSACPNLDTISLKTLLLNNVDPIPSLAGRTVTGGRLNVNKAIRACATTATPADMISPPPGSTLSSSSVTFSWSRGTGVTGYLLLVGRSVGGGDIYSGGWTANQSATVNNVPTDGSTIYVRLYSEINSTWTGHSRDYTYRAAAIAGTPADMISPANNSTFSSSYQTFNWSRGIGVANYVLYVGTGPAKSDIYGNWFTSQSATVSGLPTNGSPIYVTLWSQFNDGTWNSRPYTYTAMSGPAAYMMTPAPGSRLSPSTLTCTAPGVNCTFVWKSGAGTTWYWLQVGRSVGGGDIYQMAQTTTNQWVTVPSLPTDGSLICVRLWSWSTATNWQFRDYTYGY